MKITVCVFCSFFLFLQPLFGLVKAGEGQIDLSLQVSSFYDTEIRSSNLGQEDFVLSVRPSLVYKRPSKNLDFSASVGIDSRTYLDYDEFNETDVFFDLNISPNAELQSSRFLFTGDLLLNTETQSEDSVGEIVTTNNYGASAQLVYDPNRHYNIVASFGYRHRDPDSETYFATENVDGSLKVQAPIRGDLSIEGGLSYRDTASDGPSSDSETMTYFAGFSGSLMPELSGSLSAGIQDRSSPVLGDETSPYLSASLSLRVDERSDISLTASQGMGTTIDDRSSENLSIRLSANRSLTRELRGTIYVGYDKDEYDSQLAELVRDDKETSFGGSLTYQFARTGSVSLDIRYSDQSSSDDQYEFDRLRTGVIYSGQW